MAKDRKTVFGSERQAPDGELRTLSGETVRLSEAWSDGRAVLLVFLRHLG